MYTEEDISHFLCIPLVGINFHLDSFLPRTVALWRIRKISRKLFCRRKTYVSNFRRMKPSRKGFFPYDNFAAFVFDTVILKVPFGVMFNLIFEVTCYQVYMGVFLHCQTSEKKLKVNIYF